MTTSDLPAEGQPDVSTEGTEAPFDDVITLSTSTGEDGVVTVTVVGEVDTFTAPVLRSTLDSQLEQQPKELVIDLSGVQFLGSAGLAVLVETQKSSRAREVAPEPDRHHPRRHPPARGDRPDRPVHDRRQQRSLTTDGPAGAPTRAPPVRRRGLRRPQADSIWQTACSRIRCASRSASALVGLPERVGHGLPVLEPVDHPRVDVAGLADRRACCPAAR